MKKRLHVKLYKKESYSLYPFLMIGGARHTDSSTVTRSSIALEEPGPQTLLPKGSVFNTKCFNKDTRVLISYLYLSCVRGSCVRGDQTHRPVFASLLELCSCEAQHLT